MKTLILFGFKSCGKTHFGNLLAKRLQLPFIDTDDLLIDFYQEKNSVYEIHKSIGEHAFRELENRVIQTLRPKSPSVIALGGGSLLNADNVSHLKKIGEFIYLKAPFSTLQKRILQNKLPSFVDQSHPINSLHAIYEKRTSLYESIDAIWIDVHEENVLEKLHFIATQQEHVHYGF
jgi:shikimate kinase